MTAAELIEVIDDHGFEDLKLTRKLQVINGALRDVASREPWTALESFANLTLDTGGWTASNWPTDVAAILSMNIVATGKHITFVRGDDSMDRFGGWQTTGDPRYFYRNANGSVGFYPPGATGQEIGMNYIRVPAPVTEASAESAIWLPPEFHETIVVPGALAPLYRQTEDPGFGDVFQNLYERGIQNARVRLHIYQYQDQDYIHTMPDDAYLDDDVAW